MATDASTADDVRRRLHQIRGGPSIGDQVVSEGLRQLNLPGAYTRGLLAGRPGEKATSEELLGRPLGPVGRLAWDVATDPLTYAGPGLIKGAGQAADLLRAGGAALGTGEAANPLVNALRKFGGGESGALGLKFDPYQHAEEAGMKRWDPEWVNQRTFYHGTGTPSLTAGNLDPMKTDPKGLLGRGIYTTDEAGRGVPSITEGYAQARGAANVPQILQNVAGRARAAPAPVDLVRALDAEIRASHALTPEWADQVRAMGWRRFLPGSPAPRDVAAQGAQRLAEIHRGDLPTLMRTYGRLGLLGSESPALGHLYQGQSNFGNILDVERQLPLEEFRRLKETLLPIGERADVMAAAENPRFETRYATNIRGAGATDDLIRRARAASGVVGSRAGPSGGDPLLQGLRSAGYDALTHTGGGLWGAGEGTHQVVIGLDPNDVLGMGRATPYQQWQPYASVR